MICAWTPRLACRGAAERVAVAVDHDCPQREVAAARLGAERRRLFFVGSFVSLAAPLLPYLSGAWETAWFTLAALPLPLAVRTVVFLLGFHMLIAAIALPLAYYAGYVLPHSFDLGRQSRAAWAVDW